MFAPRRERGSGLLKASAADATRSAAETPLPSTASTSDLRSSRPSTKHVNHRRQGTRDPRQLQQGGSSYVPPYARGESWRQNSSANTRDEGRERSFAQRRESEPQRDAASYPSSLDRTSSFESASDNEKILPKNFRQPLTCFYWATQGNCVKSDEDCYYCHYHTGVVASAPVRIGNNSAVAGRYAEHVVREVVTSRKGKNIEEREAILALREAELKANEEAVEQSASHLKVAIRLMFEGFKVAYDMTDELDAKLVHIRDQIEAADQFDPVAIRNNFVEALESTEESKATILKLVTEVEEHMKTRVGYVKMKDDGSSKKEDDVE